MKINLLSEMTSDVACVAVLVCSCIHFAKLSFNTLPV